MIKIDAGIGLYMGPTLSEVLGQLESKLDDAYLFIFDFH